MSTEVAYETWGCSHCEFGVTGVKISVSVYVLRRYEGGGVWLFAGGPIGLEVVVLGGQVIVGLSKKEKTPHQGWPRGPVSRWWWVVMSMYVCDRSLGLCKSIF